MIVPEEAIDDEEILCLDSGSMQVRRIQDDNGHVIEILEGQSGASQLIFNAINVLVVGSFSVKM